MSVQPDGPAERGGVMLGDLVVAVDGQATTDVGTLVPDREDGDDPPRGGLAQLEVEVGARSLS
jgi:S1-C subfamily serine protease